MSEEKKREAPKTAWQKGQSGNPKGKPKKAVDVAPRIREAFVAVVKKGIYVNAKGEVVPKGEAGSCKVTLEQIIAQSLFDNPHGTLNAISKFLPKEVKHSGEVTTNHNINITVSETVGFIEAAVTGGSEAALPEPVPDGPLLLAAVRTAKGGHGESVDSGEVQGS